MSGLEKGGQAQRLTTVRLQQSWSRALGAESVLRIPRFTEHLERVRPLIDRAEAMPVELAYEVRLI